MSELAEGIGVTALIVGGVSFAGVIAWAILYLAEVANFTEWLVSLHTPGQITFAAFASLTTVALGMVVLMKWGDPP